MPSESFDLGMFRAQIAYLAERGVYLGTSSWKYPGWLGQIYQSERYEYRGKFALTRFEKDCLKEYAETFRTVCVDAAYYTFPTEQNLLEIADQVPSGFKFAFKVTDEITLRRFPNVPRSGARAGLRNENFLHAPLFIDQFLKPLEAIGDKAGPIIFEFTKLQSQDYPHGADFLADLDSFFNQLPRGKMYSVELRNKTWLGPEYLACLKKHQVAHVFNSWTAMPPVDEQLDIVGDQRIDDRTVARFLLKPGRTYEQAVAKFKPYIETREINERERKAINRMLREGSLKISKDGSYIYVNNRLEGSAIFTVAEALANFVNDLVQAERAKIIAKPVAPPPRSGPRPPPQLEFGI